MLSINKAIIVGHVGADPEIRFTKDKSKLAILSVATHQFYKDKATDKLLDKTDWHDVTVFRPHLVSLIEENVKKGDEIHIEGSLSKVTWSNSAGVERVQTQIQVRDAEHTVRFQRRKSKEEPQKQPETKKSKTKKAFKSVKKS